LQSVENASRQAKGSLKVSNKKGKFMPVIQARVGSETMPNEELAANALAVYNALLAQLPAKMQNIKSCLLKLSMGPAINALEAAKEGAAK
jgi:large subunit ribosomal protein L1